MKRLNTFLPEEHYNWLNDESREQKVSVAVIVRTAVEHWINLQEHPLRSFIADIVDPEFSEKADPEAYQKLAAVFTADPSVSTDEITSRLQSIESKLDEILKHQQK